MWNIWEHLYLGLFHISFEKVNEPYIQSVNIWYISKFPNCIFVNIHEIYLFTKNISNTCNTSPAKKNISKYHSEYLKIYVNIWIFTGKYCKYLGWIYVALTEISIRMNSKSFLHKTLNKQECILISSIEREETFANIGFS